MSDDIDLTPKVLRNKGVPIELAVVVQHPQLPQGVTMETARLAGADVGLGPAEVVLDEEGEPVLETVWLRFTANSIADLEEIYEGLQNWEEAMKTRPFGVVRRTIATCLGRSEQQIGAAMIPDRVPDYSAKVGIAFGIANGMDPTKAKTVLDEIERMVGEAAAEVEKQMDELVEATLSEAPSTDTPGATG